MKNKLLPLFVVLLFAACITGCSSGGRSGATVKWSGNVTLNGQALPADCQGRIIVQTTSAKGQAGSAAGAISNGYYSLSNVPQGTVIVRFSLLIPDGTPSKEDVQRGIFPKKNIAPREWQTGVQFEAVKSEKGKDFNLEDKK